ncbi:D-malate degradation protein R [Pragia fontium]|nr:D-malate degradation protein R [Pragia fontium]
MDSSDLRGISMFIAVANSGSFAGAAEKLHLTRSAVSKTIARLESKIGVTLFQRTTRKQSLTDEGQLFYEHCHRALNEIQRAQDILNEGKIQVSGCLRVSVPVLFGHLCIAPLLTELVQSHPNLQLEISFNDRAVDLIEDGFDFAIRIGALPERSSLIARQLGEHTMVFCASADYLRCHGEPNTKDDLSEHHAVAYIHSGILQKWQFIDEAGILQEIRPKAKIMMDDMQAVADAAMRGAGIAWLPYWLVREQIAQGKLKQVMKNTSGVNFPISVVWPYTQRLPLKVRVAVDKLLAELPEKLVLIESVFDESQANITR